MLSINNHSHEIPAKKNCLLEYELAKPETRKQASLQKEFNRKFKLTGKATHFCKEHGELPITSFYLTKNEYGKYYAHNHCKDCEKKYKKAAVKSNYKMDITKVRSLVRKSQSNAIKGLADWYVKKRLGDKAKGLSDEELKLAIIAKREELLQLRLHNEEIRNSPKGVKGAASERHKNELRDWYVRILIRQAASYDGHEITQDEIIAKRIEVLAKRKGIIKRGYVPPGKPEKTVAEIKANNNEKARHHIAKLSKSYLNTCVRRSSDYLGGEINDTQREAKRKEILARRESIASGSAKKSQAERLSDAYIRKVICLSKGYDGRTITKQMINEKKEQIVKKREQNNRILKPKK